MTSFKRTEPGLYTATINGEDVEIRKEEKRVDTGKSKKGRDTVFWYVVRNGKTEGEHKSYRDAKEAVLGVSAQQEEPAPAEPQQMTIASLLFPGQ